MGYNIDTGGKGVLHDKISLKNGFWPQFFAMVVRKSGNLNKKVCWIFLHTFFLKKVIHTHLPINYVFYMLSTSKTFDLCI